MEELEQALLYTNLELEKTIELANEEIESRDLELIHLRNLLSIATKEKGEALRKCQLLLPDKPFKTSNPSEDEPSIVIQDPPSSSSSSSSSFLSSPTEEEREEEKTKKKKKPLPEKGKLLQAVMEAGPLLQTLLVAGPLPQWQHPPPRMDSTDIPIPPLDFDHSGSKRVSDFDHCQGLENSPSPKLRKVVFGCRG